MNVLIPKPNIEGIAIRLRNAAREADPRHEGVEFKKIYNEICDHYEKQVEAAFKDIEHKAEMSLILNELMTIKHAMVVIMANTPIKEPQGVSE